MTRIDKSRDGIIGPKPVAIIDPEPIGEVMVMPETKPKKKARKKAKKFTPVMKARKTRK